MEPQFLALPGCPPGPQKRAWRKGRCAGTCNVHTHNGVSPAPPPSPQKEHPFGPTFPKVCSIERKSLGAVRGGCSLKRVQSGTVYKM